VIVIRPSLAIQLSELVWFHVIVTSYNYIPYILKYYLKRFEIRYTRVYKACNVWKVKAILFKPNSYAYSIAFKVTHDYHAHLKLISVNLLKTFRLEYNFEERYKQCLNRNKSSKLSFTLSCMYLVDEA
jgi:hypothetical protein